MSRVIVGEGDIRSFGLRVGVRAIGSGMICVLNVRFLVIRSCHCRRRRRRPTKLNIISALFARHSQLGLIEQHGLVVPNDHKPDSFARALLLVVYSASTGLVQIEIKTRQTSPVPALLHSLEVDVDSLVDSSPGTA